jgi:hypothetical protein
LRRRGYQFAGVAGASERVSCALTSVHFVQRPSDAMGHNRTSHRCLQRLFVCGGPILLLKRQRSCDRQRTLMIVSWPPANRRRRRRAFADAAEGSRWVGAPVLCDQAARGPEARFGGNPHPAARSKNDWKVLSENARRVSSNPSLRCRETEFLGQRQTARKGAGAQGVAIGRQNLLADPADSGLIAGFGEISVRTRMRGGPGRTSES